MQKEWESVNLSVPPDGCYILTYHSDVTEQHRALRVDAQSFLKVDFCQVELLLFVVNHPQTIPTHTHFTLKASTVLMMNTDIKCTHCCLYCYPTSIVTMVTVPCVVVSVVDPDGVSEAGESSVQLLGQNKLMTQQSVGVRKARVHLRDRQVIDEETERKAERNKHLGRRAERGRDREGDRPEGGDRAALSNSLQPIWKSQRPIFCKTNKNIPRFPLSR